VSSISDGSAPGSCAVEGTTGDSAAVPAGAGVVLLLRGVPRFRFEAMSLFRERP
jgi:hypothetical protein